MASQTNGFALTQSAVVDTQQGEAAKEGRGVEVRHVRLQGCAFLIFGAGNTLKDRLEERLEILGGDVAVAGVGQRGFPCLCRGVDNGDIQQRVNIGIHAFAHEVLSQCKKQVLGFRDDLVDTCIGTVNLIDNDHDGKLGLKGLAKNETGLREGAFRGIDKENDAIDHGQASFNFTTKVSVSGGVDDVNDHATFEPKLLSSGTAIVDRSVLGENRNALFAFKIA